MSRREDIDNSIWSDPDFNTLSPAAKIVYLWTFTNPRCGMAGIYKTSTRAISLDTGLEVERVNETLDELAEGRFVRYEDKVLWVRTRVKHLRTRTNQIARAIANDLAKINEAHPLRLEFIETYGATPWLANALLDITDAEPAHVSLTVRKLVFERDDWACIDCGSQDDLTIDHVVPRSAGGTSVLNNLATRCKSCNSRKGAVNPERHQGSNRTSVNVSEGQRGSATLQGKGRVKEENNGPSRVREAGSEFDDAQARLKADELPDDLPQRLHDAALQVQQRLLRLHDRKPGSLRPALGAIGRVLASMPDRAHVDVADDVEHYWSFGGGQEVRRVDLVATYRNRLKTAPVVAGGQGPAGGIDDIVARAERRERLLEQQRREREATAGARS